MEKMTSRKRLEIAWSFKEPDRVPIELQIPKHLQTLPELEQLVEFEKNEADNFIGVSGFDWGLLGLDYKYLEEIIEDIPGEFKRIKRGMELGTY